MDVVEVLRQFPGKIIGLIYNIFNSPRIHQNTNIVFLFTSLLNGGGYGFFNGMCGSCYDFFNRCGDDGYGFFNKMRRRWQWQKDKSVVHQPVTVLLKN
jgi:hypothetical protein